MFDCQLDVCFLKWCAHFTPDITGCYITFVSPVRRMSSSKVKDQFDKCEMSFCVAFGQWSFSLTSLWMSCLPNLFLIVESCWLTLTTYGKWGLQCFRFCFGVFFDVIGELLMDRQIPQRVTAISRCRCLMDDFVVLSRLIDVSDFLNCFWIILTFGWEWDFFFFKWFLLYRSGNNQTWVWLWNWVKRVNQIIHDFTKGGITFSHRISFKLDCKSFKLDCKISHWYSRRIVLLVGLCLNGPQGFSDLPTPFPFSSSLSKSTCLPIPDAGLDGKSGYSICNALRFFTTKEQVKDINKRTNP